MGMERVPPETRERHATFLLQSQRPDGGFAGRMGESDLYYTSFALRALSILGELYGDVAQRATNFLQSRLHAPEKLIDHMSLVFGAALLDLDEPWKVLYRTEPYILNPRTSYECVGDVPNVVFPTATIAYPEKDDLRIYYGGADTVFCLATAKISEP